MPADPPFVRSSQPLFQLDTLGDLDQGTVRLLVDAAISEALADCDSRPSLESVRKVVLTLELKPRQNQIGGLKGVDANVQVQLKVPARQGGSTFLPTETRGTSTAALLPADYQEPLYKENN